MTLPARFLEHVRSERLFPEPGVALVAVSGGPDSVALAELLVAVAPELGLEPVVAHVDHGIDPASGEVAEQVRRVAARLGLRLRTQRLELGAETSETTARRERYRALRAMQQEEGARYLVTAHHADDQAETVLLRFLKGSGLAGLAGIPARGPRGLVRPLLPFTRHALEEWRGRTSAPDAVHRDPANRDERHDRSWIRHRVLPVLETRRGWTVHDRLLDVAHHAAADRQAWSAVLRALPDLEFRRGRGAAEVARGPLQNYDNVLSEALLRALAREVGCVIGPRRARQVRRFVEAGSSGGSLPVGGGWDVEINFGRVRVVRRGDVEPVEPVACELGADGRVRWGGWEFSWCPEAAGSPRRAGLSTWVTPGAATIRAMAAGDRLRPLGGVGRRKVRRLLMEARVPVRERMRYPLLERDGDVLWIPGVCRSTTEVPSVGEQAVRIDASTVGTE